MKAGLVVRIIADSSTQPKFFFFLKCRIQADFYAEKHPGMVETLRPYYAPSESPTGTQHPHRRHCFRGLGPFTVTNLTLA